MIGFDTNVMNGDLWVKSGHLKIWPSFMALTHRDPFYSLLKAREPINGVCQFVCQFVGQSVSLFVCVPQTQGRFGPGPKCDSLLDPNAIRSQT